MSASDIVTPAIQPPSKSNPLRRVLWIAVGILTFVILLVATLFYFLFVLPLPKINGSAQLPGLKAPVQVERDSNGIPHIAAQSLEDLYEAQGYVTAQDRLWQMELLRRVARGDVSEVAGPRALSLDIDSRTIGMRVAAEAAVKTLPEDQKRWISAYTRGVNEFISAHSLSLPVEFRLVRVTPRPWDEADSLAIGLHMFRTLTTSWKDELLKTAMLGKIGPRRTAELLITRSDRDIIPGVGVEGSGINKNRQSALLPVWNITSPLTLDPSLLEASPADDPGFPGSNNWVVAPAHTASGRAMLANDPHLDLAVPDIWYVAHLSAPNMDVAGVTLPGLPAVIIGHNASIAWGMTNLGADVQDLYLEVFDPDNPRRYLVNGEWKEAQIREETIHVKGQADQELRVTVTRHGPLVVNLPGERYALRWVATEPNIWRFPFAEINAAANWDQFTSALRKYPGPAQNFVYADSIGNIGYYGAGLIPIRPKGDGSYPLAGDDPTNDWKGYIPFDQLPHVYNPPSGIIATANARVVPDNYPYPVATRWESPDRTERIYQLLDPQRKLTPDDFRKIQVDVYAAHHHKIAKAVVEAAMHEKDRPARVMEALNALRQWDGVAREDSYATSIVQYTREHLKQKLLLPVLGDLYPRYDWHMQNVFLENALATHPKSWLPAAYADYDHLLMECLSEALSSLEKRFGTPQMSAWRWGKIMEMGFTHPIGNAVPGLRRLFNIGPFEQAGTGFTVKQTTHSLGPSMRLVVDFGDLDKATLTLSTGESGHPLSRHYRDQFPKWLSSEGVALPFAPNQARHDKLVLNP